MNKLIIILLLTAAFSYAQVVQKPVQSTKNESVNLVLKTRFTGKEVKIRWVPSRAGAWALLNQTGYVLMRYEHDENGKTINRVRMTPQPIKPEPLAQWKRFEAPPQNEKALVAAGAIYSESFRPSKATSLVEKADELNNRYSFTVLAADLSFEAAKAAGLGFMDTHIEAGKAYFYTLYAAQKLANYTAVDTAFAFIDTKKIAEVSRPIWQKPTESEHRIDLLWSKALHKTQFTAYYIERSADGRSYQRLSKDPYINMTSEIEQKPDFLYTDSVKVNYQPYYYRLVGITTFGEESPPSEPVKAMGRDLTPPRAPANVQAKSLGGRRVEITWKAGQESDLQGFFVARSQNSLENFKPLFTKPLARNIRRYVDEQAQTDTTNYYMVVAVDTSQNAAASLSAYSPIIDSIAPAKPQGLTAKISNKGIVTLQWNRNKERDIKGYLVFVANQRNHFFTAASRRVTADTMFRDTIVLRTLTEKIYYQVKAVDRSDNTSGPSDILEATKPDIVPPSPPVFTNFEVKANGVLLKWVPSSSKDVVLHRILRKGGINKTFEELGLIEKNVTFSFLDNTAQPNQGYQYMIEAEDDAGLISTGTAVIYVKTPDFRTKATVQNFKVQYDIAQKQVNINWQNPATVGAFVVLYRADNGGAFLTLISPPKGTTQYQDRNVKPKTVYEYTTRIFYPDGKSSPFGTISKLNF